MYTHKYKDRGYARSCRPGRRILVMSQVCHPDCPGPFFFRVYVRTQLKYVVFLRMFRIIIFFFSGVRVQKNRKNRTIVKTDGTRRESRPELSDINRAHVRDSIAGLFIGVEQNIKKKKIQ